MSIRRTISRIKLTTAIGTERRRNPSPTASGMVTGSAAMSPHIDKGTPLSMAACAVI
jgi:hypothetical protein